MFNKTDDQQDQDIFSNDDNNDDDVSQNKSTDDTNNSNDLVTPNNTDELLDIKQQALLELSPLIDHLNQTPEEKFKTTMMMIQASDNKDLLKDAFTIAKTITDDKTRAEALLDIINEVNYFTQKNLS